MITPKQLSTRSTSYDYFNWVSRDNPITGPIIILRADLAETGERLAVNVGFLEAVITIPWAPLSLPPS